MKYSINIDHELRIIKYKQSGSISMEDIENTWMEFKNMQEFTQLKYNLLLDFRGGKFQIPIERLTEIIAFMRKIENIVRGKKQALIVDDPYSAAASMLFKIDVYKEVGFDVQLFSTETAALDWLLY